MSKEEFKKRWESNENGGGITFDEVADCAIKWGLTNRPKTMSMDDVLEMVLQAAGIEEPK